MQHKESPQNGIAGLKHWRYDLLAGLQVALVSLPLSLGIAVASGAPPITGVVSAIIAGLIFPFLGGAYVTISGPAAGLAPALFAGMLTLGQGDLAAGYPLLLVAICLTGLVQVILSLFKAGRFAIFFPGTVVEAMLAAIGIIIIVKQIPALVGDLSPAAKSIMASIGELPQTLLRFDWSVLAIGALSLFLMFYLNRTRQEWMRKVPAPLMVSIVGIVLGFVFQLGPDYLIRMPEDTLEGGITLPAFAEVWSRPELWGAVLLVVITLTLIDGIESLATIAAVDKIDPFQRKSHPNVTLRAMGVSNMLSSIFGGLTIIPGGIKSRANIDAGGRTLWANFYNAIFLLAFLFLAKELISRVPLASIGAILVYVGWRLCEFQVFRKTYSIGLDQIVIFVITVVAILMTDLLFGIIIGIIAEVIMLVYLLSPSLRALLTGRLTFQQAAKLVWENLAGLFRSPVIKVRHDTQNGRPHYEISLGSVVCFNLLPLNKVLESIPANAGVTLVVTESGRIIDHTGMEFLHQFEEECVRARRPFALHGLEKFHQFTPHSLSARLHDAKLVREKARQSERAQQMSAIAAQHGLSFSDATASVLNSHDFLYLRRGDQRQEFHVMSGRYRDLQLKIFDYSHTSAPDYYSEHLHTIMILHRLKAAAVPDFVITPGHYLQRYLVNLEEIDSREPKLQAAGYRLYAKSDSDRVRHYAALLAEFLVAHPGFYLEWRDSAVLAFCPDHEMETPNGIDDLFELAALIAALPDIDQTPSAASGAAPPPSP